MKRIVVFLMVALIVGFALADRAQAEREPTTKLFSQCEQMWFCNGLFPDAGYRGCWFREMDAGQTDVTIGDCSPAADTTITLGRVTSTLHYGLLRYDISAVPDSAVITEARLYVKLQAVTAANNTLASLKMLRLMVPWDTTASWDYRWFYNDEETDLTWAGATDTSASGIAIFGGATGFIKAKHRLVANTSSQFVLTLNGSPNYSIPDSLFDGDFAGGDVVEVFPASSGSGGGELLIASTPILPGWIGIDVTEAVRKWHTGGWGNYGWKMLWGDKRTNTYWTLYSNCSTTGNRPRLLVKYLYAVAGSSVQRRGEFGGK